MTGEAKRVCIIGAGPAGLFAAYHLSRFVRNTTITILESGPKSRNGSSNLPNRDIRCPVTIDGPGGAGVFADKLYFDPAGGWLEDESKLDARAYMALVAEIFEKFTGYADWGSGANPANNLQISGLVYKPYPNIISATLREYLRFVGKLMTELRTRGVKIRFSHEVRSIRLLPDSTFALGLKGGQRLDCDIVLLATGRGSTTWLERQARRLGLKFAPADALLGVRIETLTSRVSGLRALNLDPKIRTSDRSTRLHCVCYGGRVISCRCEGMVLVDGTKFHPTTKNTSFNIITSLRALGMTSVHGRSAVHDITGATRGYPVVQRMRDFRDGNPSAPDSVKGGEVRRTLSISRAGNTSPHLPDQVRAEVINFIDLMSSRFPGVSAPDNLVYAPVFEWFYRKVRLNKKEWSTSVPGLFVIGDAAGLSQGVVMACASGIRGAFAIDSYLNGANP